MKRTISILMAIIFSLSMIYYSNAFQRIDEVSKYYNKYFSDYKVLKSSYKWMNPRLYSIIKRECYLNNLPVSLVCAVIQNESEGKYNAISCAGAIGLMQIIPRYHLLKNETKNVLYDPKVNIHKGCSFLKWCLTFAQGDLRVALKNYNSGPYSNFFNTPYINRITKAHHQVSIALENVS